MNIIDFAAARARIQAVAALNAEYRIEIDARSIPAPVLIDRLKLTLNESQLGELLTMTLEECK